MDRTDEDRAAQVRRLACPDCGFNDLRLWTDLNREAQVGCDNCDWSTFDSSRL